MNLVFLTNTTFAADCFTQCFNDRMRLNNHCKKNYGGYVVDGIKNWFNERELTQAQEAEQCQNQAAEDCQTICRAQGANSEPSGGNQFLQGEDERLRAIEENKRLQAEEEARIRQVEQLENDLPPDDDGPPTDDASVNTQQVANCRPAPGYEEDFEAVSRCSQGNDLRFSNFSSKCVCGGSNGDEFTAEKPPKTEDPSTSAPSDPTSLKAQRELEIQNDIESLSERLDGQCKEKREEASKCCGNGYACIGEALGANEKLAGMAGPAIQVLATGYASSPIGANGIADMCKKAKNTALFGAALNTALGGLCTYKAEQCKSACGEILDDIKKNQKTNCDDSFLNSVASAEIKKNFVESCNDDYNELWKHADNRYLGACERADSKTVEHIMSAASAAQAAKFAKFCEDRTIGLDPNNQLQAKTEHQFSPDCNTPAGASNPVCQNPCMRNPNSTECQNFLASNGQPVGVVGTDDPLAANPFGDLPDLGESPDPAAVAPPVQQGLAVSPNGGGGAGLPGGGGIGGGGGGAPGAPGSDTPNGIIKGQKSGSGYIPSYARSGARGGYSGRARGPASAKGKGFNLKKYLPKDKLAPKRKISSLSGHPQVAPKTSNIFQRISARYREVCLRNRLYECNKLVKSKSRRRGK